MSELTSSSPVQSPVQAADQIDPHSLLRVGMRVIGSHSTPLGKVESFERDTSGSLTSVTVRHGMFGKRRTVVAATQMKWLNQDSVVLELNRKQFKRLEFGQITGAQPSS